MELISIAEASKMLGVSRQTLLNWAKEGYLDVKSVGPNRMSLFDRKAVLAIAGKTQEIEHLRELLNQELLELEAKREEVKSAKRELQEDLHLIHEIGIMTINRHFFLSIPKMLEEMGEITLEESAIMQEIISGRDVKDVASTFSLSTASIRLIFKNGCKKAAQLSLLKERMHECESLVQMNKDLLHTVKKLNDVIGRVDQELVLDVKLYTSAEEREAWFDKNDSLIRLLHRPLDNYDFPVRVRNSFRAGEVVTIGDLVRLQRTDFLKFRNMGEKSVRFIDNFLKQHHLSFGMDVDKIRRERIAILLADAGIDQADINYLIKRYY